MEKPPATARAGKENGDGEGKGYQRQRRQRRDQVSRSRVADGTAGFHDSEDAVHIPERWEAASIRRASILPGDATEPPGNAPTISHEAAILTTPADLAALLDRGCTDFHGLPVFTLAVEGGSWRLRKKSERWRAWRNSAWRETDEPWKTKVQASTAAAVIAAIDEVERIEAREDDPLVKR